jgi:GNAT superfamily N-acetyltransferase
MNPILTVSSEPEPAAEKVVGDGLNAFNDATVGYADRLALHVIVRDSDSGKIVGGISGRTSLGLMFIDLVYLPEALRGHDIGTRMMAMAEEEARRRGCRGGVLTRSAFRRQASISAWDGAFLAKSLATRQAPVGFF